MCPVVARLGLSRCRLPAIPEFPEIVGRLWVIRLSGAVFKTLSSGCVPGQNPRFLNFGFPFKVKVTFFSGICKKLELFETRFSRPPIFFPACFPAATNGRLLRLPVFWTRTSGGCPPGPRLPGSFSPPRWFPTALPIGDCLRRCYKWTCSPPAPSEPGPWSSSRYSIPWFSAWALYRLVFRLRKGIRCLFPRP